MNKGIKVILFSNLFPNCVEPERGIFTYQIVRHLNKICDLKVVSPLPYFPRIRILAFAKKWWIFSQVPFHSTYKGVDSFYPKFFILPKIGDYMTHWTLFLRFFLFLKRMSSIEKPDLINAQWVYPDGVAASMVGQRLNIPVVISLLGSDINRDIHKKHLNPLIINALNECEKIVSVSDDIKQTIISHGIKEQKIVVINNGVDSHKFRIRDRQKCQKKFGLDKDNKYIIFVGRLEPVKGLDVLIKAIGECSKKMQKTKVILVGDGSLQNNLRKEINKRGLTDFFIFAGAQSYSLVPQWLSCADVFCLPSLNEGHPNVIMEALAAGIPVVASRVGEIQKYVTSECGFVFPPGNHRKLGTLLCTSLSREWDSATIRKTVEKQSWEEIAKVYLKEFKSTLEGAGKSQ